MSAVEATGCVTARVERSKACHRLFDAGVNAASVAYPCEECGLSGGLIPYPSRDLAPTMSEAGARRLVHQLFGHPVVKDLAAVDLNRLTQCDFSLLRASCQDRMTGHLCISIADNPTGLPAFGCQIG